MLFNLLHAYIYSDKEKQISPKKNYSKAEVETTVCVGYDTNCFQRHQQAQMP